MMSHLPGLSLVAGVAMGLGVMTAGMLRLPMTAVLLTALFLGSDSFPVLPLVIVAVVVCYIAVIWLSPPSPTAPPAREQAPPAPAPRRPADRDEVPPRPSGGIRP